MKILIRYTGLLCLILCLACDSSEPEQKADTPPKKETKTTETTSKETDVKNIVFFGNSLSAGYGVTPEECFAGLIEQRIDSLKLPYKVINAGLSGETTAGGASRIDWILKQPIDIFILELGGNDGLRGIKPEASYENLQTIIDKTKAKYPEVTIILAGMMAPPNMGGDFTTKFRAIFPKIAEVNETLLIPFLLEGVGGIPSLNQPDGIHPNPKGHRIVAENVWSILETAL